MAAQVTTSAKMTAKEIMNLNLKRCHLNGFIEVLCQIIDPEIFTRNFWILKANVPRTVLSTSYVFITSYDPDILATKEENSFRFALVGLGKYNLPYLIIRPYFKSIINIEGPVYQDSKIFTPFQGTVSTFLNELSFNCKEKIERKDLVKQWGKLPDLFENMYLCCQVPLARTIKRKANLVFKDLQSFSSDFAHEKKERQESPIKPDLKYIARMMTRSLKLTDKYFRAMDPETVHVELPKFN